MNKLVLPLDLAQRILNYLETRPYKEVAALIAEMLRASENQPKQDTAPEVVT